MNFLILNYYFYIIFVIFFTYHGFNGVRHILCSLGYLLDVNNVRSSFYIIMIILLVIVVVNLMN